MSNNFRIAAEIKPDKAGWGASRRMSDPASTGARQMTVIEAVVLPGEGHGFHKHPGQEEVIYVVAGKVEQWVDREKRILGPGDAAFIPAGMVHASFNIGQNDVRLVVSLSPCMGDGYELVDVSDQAPWKELRS